MVRPGIWTRWLVPSHVVNGRLVVVGLPAQGWGDDSGNRMEARDVRCSRRKESWPARASQFGESNRRK